MIRNKWDYIIRNVSLMAKVSAYTKKPSAHGPSTNSVSTFHLCLSPQGRANAKTAEMKVWQVPQNCHHCSLLLSGEPVLLCSFNYKVAVWTGFVCLSSGGNWSWGYCIT